MALTSWGIEIPRFYYWFVWHVMTRILHIIDCWTMRVIGCKWMERLQNLWNLSSNLCSQTLISLSFSSNGNASHGSWNNSSSGWDGATKEFISWNIFIIMGCLIGAWVICGSARYQWRSLVFLCSTTSGYGYAEWSGDHTPQFARLW